MNKELKKENKKKFFSENFFEFFKKFNSSSYLLWFFIFLFCVSFILWIFYFFQVEEPLPLVCGDGTFYNTCSLNKPYYCLNGKLVEDSYHCGCPEEMIKEEEGCRYENFTKGEKRNFKYLVEGKEFSLDFYTYEGFSEYLDLLPRSIEYDHGEVSLRSDFKKLKLSDPYQREILLPLIVKIWNLFPNSQVDQARIAISLVQNLEYADNPEKKVEGGLFNVSIYPYQVLEEGAGSCESKSELLAHLLSELGFGVSTFYYVSENHEAVGIKCPVHESLNGTGYCFVETVEKFPISFYKGSYSTSLGLKLYTIPEVVIISKGISLPENLIEYSDSEKLEKAFNKKAGFFGLFNKVVLNNLKEKYGFEYFS